MHILLRFAIFMLFYRAITLGFRVPVRFGSSAVKGIASSPSVSRVSRLPSSIPTVDAPKKGKSERKQPIKQYSDFVECLKTKDADRALSLLKDVTMVNDRMFVVLMNNIATVFSKKEHLSAVQDIIKRLEDIDVTPDEPLYSALIKCHMDAKNIEKAFNVFQYMVGNSIEVKSRTLLPIMEGLRDAKDVATILPVLKYITNSIDIKPEHLTIVMQLLGQLPPNSLTLEQKTELDAFLVSCSQKLLGLPTTDLQKIAASFNNITLSAQQEEGVLVEFLPDAVIDSSNLTTQGYVTAYVPENPSGAVSMQEALPGMVNTDPNHPIGLSETAEPTKDVVERLFLRSTVDTLRKSTSSRRAKIVNIDARTCQCPNCNARLSSLALTEDEKRIVRSKLRSISKETNQQLLVSVF